MIADVHSPLILVVDDQAPARFIARESLRHAGMRVTEAAGDEQALDAIANERPDLVLINTQLTPVSGFDLCERIRARPATHHLPVLMLSAAEDEHSIRRIYEAGATDFIVNPYRRHMLVQRVRHLLREQRNGDDVRRQAYTDPLTGLPNRASLMLRLEQTLARTGRDDPGMALLFLDLDRFAPLSASIGARASDALLKEVARRLARCVAFSDGLSGEADQEPGDVLARVGLDEFVFLLGAIEHTDDATIVARRIVDELSAAYPVHDCDVEITCAIGIATCPADAGTPGELLECAEAAMYAARAKGPNRYRRFQPSMLEARHRYASMEQQIGHALHRGELWLAYQPQVNLNGGEVSGVEALLRWRNDELGDVLPGEFLPAAHDSAAIAAIDRWVLGSACEQARDWQTRGLALSRITVNTSLAHFARPAFVDDVVSILHRTGLEADVLELDVTESLLGEDIEAAIRTIAMLRHLGVKVAIDDFGAGSSSLAHLKRVPASRLKIAASFVHGMTWDPQDAAVASAIIAIAKSMGMDVLAEGVESGAQMSRLLAAGCHQVQGHYFSEPVPAGTMTKLLSGPALFAPHAARARDPGPDGRTVLFVDDDPGALDYFAHVLRHEPIQVMTALKPSQAFDKLAVHPASVIVSDLDMPEMNGTQFLERVRQLLPASTRVLLSGQGDLAALGNAVNDAAIFRFVEKPVAPDALRQVVRDAFEQYHETLRSRTEVASESMPVVDLAQVREARVPRPPPS